MKLHYRLLFINLYFNTLLLNIEENRRKEEEEFENDILDSSETCIEWFQNIFQDLLKSFQDPKFFNFSLEKNLNQKEKAKIYPEI